MNSVIGEHIESLRIVIELARKMALTREEKQAVTILERYAANFVNVVQEIKEEKTKQPSRHHYSIKRERTKCD